jgi:hypothetical protein
MSKLASRLRATIAASGAVLIGFALAARTQAQVAADGPRMSVLTSVSEPGIYNGANFIPPYQIKITFEIANQSEDVAGNSMTSFTIGAGLLDGILAGIYENGNLWVATWQPIFNDHSVTFYADPHNPSFALDPGYPGVLSVFAATNITMMDGIATATASGNASVTNRFNEVSIKVPQLIAQLEPVTLASPSYRNGVFSADFNTRSNRLYTVWMNTGLRTTNWTVLAQYPGDGRVVSFSDPNPVDQARYYRVETGGAKP